MTTLLYTENSIWVCPVCDSANEEADLRCMTCGHDDTGEPNVWLGWSDIEEEAA